MEELTLDSILTGDQINNLFSNEETQGSPPEEKGDKKDAKKYIF